MAQIHVVIPAPSSDGNSPDPMVLNDPKPLMGGRFVSWHIYCYNKDVTQVKVEFAEDRSRYFEDKQGVKQKHLTKKLLKVHEDGAAQDPNKRWKSECVVYGQAPVHPDDDYSKSKSQHVVEKYTVTGLDGKGKPVSALDPEIINDKPRP